MNGTLSNGSEVTIETVNRFPPVPFRDMDWIATLDNYDGAPDAGYQPTGEGATEAEAVQNLLVELEDAILEQLEEESEYNDSMDGDHESALASAGWGTDEDYGGADDHY